MKTNKIELKIDEKYKNLKDTLNNMTIKAERIVNEKTEEDNTLIK